MKIALYLSPHYDDAALSCGGLIHQQAQAGQSVMVVTVCAAPPADPLSPYAARMHARWSSELGPKEIVTARQAEDNAAMQRLGAIPIYLGFNDCIYRGYPHWYYNQSTDIFGAIHANDVALIDKIVAACQAIAPPQNITLYAPLAIGNHVDHQLTHAAAWQLGALGYDVYFYEDYPYSDPAFPFNQIATRPNDNHRLQARLTHIMAERQITLISHLSPLSATNLQAKAKSICAYASQIGTLFGEATSVLPRIQDYAEYVGQGQWAERYWK